MEDSALDYYLRRGRTLTNDDAVLQPWLGGDIVSLWNVVAELANRFGYNVAEPRVAPLDVDAERKRMKELRNTIERLKNDTV